MQIVVLQAAALVDEQPERDVERLFSGSSDPEVTVPLLVHGNEALFEDATADHQVVDAKK